MASSNNKRNKSYLMLIKEQLFLPLDYISNYAKRLMITNIKDSATLFLLGKEIKTEIDNLSFQVNNILYLEEIENNKLELKKNRVDINRVIQKVLDELSHLIETKNINIELNVFCRNEFYSDIKKIHTILINLIANAIEFSDTKGTVQIIFFEEDDCFKLIIEDDGKGIEDSKKYRIFNKFYQSNEDTIRVQRAQGLGLFVVKGLVEFLKGNIKLDTKTKESTLFEITLPKLTK